MEKEPLHNSSQRFIDYGRKFTKKVLTYIVYFLFLIALIFVIFPAFEEIYRQYGGYPFLLGIIAYVLASSSMTRLRKIFETHPYRNQTKALVIAAGVIFAAPVIFSELYLALPGNLPWKILPSDSTAEVINEARICKNDPLNDGDMCIFKISPDLDFEIRGVGTPLATAYINEANPPEKSYYYIGFSSSDPCIRIKTGTKKDKRISDEYFIKHYFNKATAWLSPFDAVAYTSYDECIEKTEASLKEFRREQAGL